LYLGVTTSNARAGTGSTGQNELKLLGSIARWQAASRCACPTFLARHTIPAEWREDRAGYARCCWTIPEIGKAGLAAFCDVFVEDSAFSVDEAVVFSRREGSGTPAQAAPAAHLGEGGARAEVGATSADHPRFASDGGIARWRGRRRGGEPSAGLDVSRSTAHAARKFIDAGVAVAVATDFNPGSAPSYHLPLALTLAARCNG